jgi:RNA polymerase sigma-70 factor (ECF subfamily)
MAAAKLTPLVPLEPLDDAELVRRARGKEEYARDVLYRRHVQFVAAVALRLGRDRAEVDDVVQETFITAFDRLEQLTDAGALRGWLASIAVSLVHRRLRWSRLWRLFRDDAEAEASLESMAAPDCSPEIRAQLSQLDARVSKLPIAERTAWTLRFVLGCTLEEVAAGCACSLATAKRRLAAAQKRIGIEVEIDS